MNTETTKIAQALDINGWVLFDGDCPLCSAWAARLEAILTRRGFDLAPLQSPWVAECLDLPISDPPGQMLVLSAEGKLFGGMEGILFIARLVWWAWPLHVIALLPIVRRGLHKGYSWIAAHRMCLGGHCTIHAHHH